jgi:hypothetical protein
MQLNPRNLLALSAVGVVVLACGGAVPRATPFQSDAPTPSLGATQLPAASPPASPTAVLPAGSWSASGRTRVAHVDDSTATLLMDGRLVIVGGENRSAETYNPNSGEFTLAQDTSVVRRGHTATRLADGRVLVAGGFDGQKGIVSSELYDPAQGSWTETGSMTEGRYSHAAVLLSDGRVLVVGGWTNDARILASAEIYDPNTGTWSAAGSLSHPYGYPGAVALKDGTVLVVGGQDDGGAVASAEVFDAVTLSWAVMPSMIHGRSLGTTTLLDNGRVLVAGGGAGPSRLQSAEIFDPANQTWSDAAPMTEPRSQQVAVLLADGRVLVAGGGNTHNPTAEIYDPGTDTWKQTGPMTVWRASPLAALLADGRVLLAGGFTDDPMTSELFDPHSGGAVVTPPPWFSRCEPGCQGPITGPFVSAGFLQGLKLTIAAEGWFNSADYADELQFDRGDDVVRFWRNPGASSPQGELIADIPKTPEGLTQWLVTNPNLSASPPDVATIDGIAATTLTVVISPANVNVDPECPPDVRSCLPLILVKEHHDFAIGYGEAVRFYLFNIGPLGPADTIVISLDAPNSQRLAQLTADMQPILDSIDLP